MTIPASFVISLDTELAWGRINDPELPFYLDQCLQASDIIKELLELFDGFEIPATWALVGRMFDEKGLEYALSEFYPDIDLKELTADNVMHNNSNSAIRFNDVVDLIKRTTAEHEIASHSYNHVLFDTLERDDAKLAIQDIEMQKEAFKNVNVKPETIVFPQDKIGCLDAFNQAGYKYFRGKLKEQKMDNGVVNKVNRQLAHVFPLRPECVLPQQHSSGLYELKTSLLYRIPSRGIKRYTSMQVLTNRAIIGIYHAVESGMIFHLYFHPFNFGYRRKEHMRGLKRILGIVRELMVQGKIEALTIKNAIEKYVKTSELESITDE